MTLRFSKFLILGSLLLSGLGIQERAWASNRHIGVCMPFSNLPGQSEQIRILGDRDEHSARTELEGVVRVEWRRSFGGWPGVFDSANRSTVTIQFRSNSLCEGKLDLGTGNDTSVSLTEENPGLRNVIQGYARSGTLTFTRLAPQQHKNEVIRSYVNSIRTAAGVDDGYMIELDAVIDSKGDETSGYPCLLVGTLVAPSSPKCPCRNQSE